MTSLSKGTPDDFKAIVHKMKRHATNPDKHDVLMNYKLS